MYEPLSIRKNFSWTFAGSLIAAGCQWLMLMSMTKLLSVAEVGNYALALAITAPVIRFSMVQLRAVQVTDAKGLYKFGDYFGARLLTNIFAILVISGILFGLVGRYDFRVLVVVFIVGLNKVIEATSDITYGLVQKHERLDKVSQSMIYRNVGAAILLALVLYLTRSLIYGVAVIGLWWLLILAFFDGGNARKFDHFVPHFNSRKIFSVIWLGLPLGVGTGLLTLNENIPRYFVGAHMGTENLGFFAAMAYVVIGASRCSAALNTSVSARLARYFIDNKAAYVRLLIKVVIITAVVSVGAIIFGVLFGKQFLSIVYKPEYADQPDVFVWLLVVAGVNMVGSVFGVGMTSARRFKSHLPVLSVTFGVCLLMCWLLIPVYGMKGAAWAMLAAALTQCLGSLIVIILALRAPAESETAGSDG